MALLLGCGGGTAGDGAISACIAEHPPAEPFDVGDTQGVAMPAPVPGGAPIVEPPPTPADIAQDCREGGGSGCDERAFISRDAAECIARETGLATGLAPWNTTIGYFQNHQRVGWGIMTVREQTSDGYWGELLVLDATTGAELDRGSYEVRPSSIRREASRRAQFGARSPGTSGNRSTATVPPSGPACSSRSPPCFFAIE